MNMSNKKTALALVSTAALGVGVLSACGSPSASESPSPTSSETTSRDAGIFTKEIKLIVTNNTDGYIRMTQTKSGAPVGKGAAGSTKQISTYTVAPGGSSDYTFDYPGAIIHGTTGNSVDSFLAANPGVGLPYVRYSDTKSATSFAAEQEDLEVGQSIKWKSSSTGRTYVIKRGEDTNTKVFTITVR